MLFLLRAGIAAVTAIAAFYVTAGALSIFMPDGLLPVSLAAAVAAALWIARKVWRGTSGEHAGLASYAGMGAVVVGAIGFAAGFFGPLILTPEANQGPLLGIFITGPLGMVVGAIGGAVYWRISTRVRR
jgi:hypothetical protein